MEHDLIKTGDPDSFPAIEDGNGDVALGYCRRCKQAEADLEPECPGERKEFKLAQHPADAKVGEYATIEQLLSAGGKFFTIQGSPDGSRPDRAYCDLPFSSWELKNPTDPGYQRIE